MEHSPNNQTNGNARKPNGKDTELVPLKKIKDVQTGQDVIEERQLRKRLHFYYSNPCQRFNMTDRGWYRRTPFKLIVQILKVIFITTQAVLLGLDRSSLATHTHQSNLALKSIFLQNYTPSDSEMPITSDNPDLAIYITNKIYELTDYAVDQYQVVQSLAFGSFYRSYYGNGTVKPVNIAMRYYNTRNFIPQNDTLTIDSSEKTETFDVINFGGSYDFKVDLQNRNLLRNMDRLLEINVRFDLKNVFLGSLFGLPNVHCYELHNNILFDNNERSGKVGVILSTEVSEIVCKQGSYLALASKGARVVILALVVIVLNVLSLIFSIGAFKSSLQLMLSTKIYFKRNLNVGLPLKEQFSFIKIWDILMILNDILVFLGTLMILFTTFQVQTNVFAIYDAAMVLIGVGVLLVYLCVLKFFSYYPTFYLLFLILRKALFKVIRYVICVGILYAGFVLCGWLVLGPYHTKFMTFLTTSELLFATMNGDGIFDTFAEIPVSAGYIWLFSRVYLYTYIALFTTIALNLGIAILLDSYETIKNYVKHGFPKTRVVEFLELTHTHEDDDDLDYETPYFCMTTFRKPYSINRDTQNAEVRAQ